MADLLELCAQAGLELKKKAATHGGEFEGPCPKCGCGEDRFLAWPNQQQNNCVGRYWCRVCGTKGDSLQFCMDFLGMPWDQAVNATNANVSFDKGPQRYKIKEPKAKAIVAPPDIWREMAARLVSWAHRGLLGMPGNLECLGDRGLPVEAVKRYQLGYVMNPKHVEGSFFRNREEWGLEPEQKQDGSFRKLWIPEGILIPMISPKGSVDRLIVRRTHWKEGDEFPKYAFVSGGMTGLVRVGDRSLKTVVVVESELDALAGHNVFGDQALFIAIGGNTKTPDALSNHLMLNSEKLIVCHDRDEGGEVLLEKMRTTWGYSHAISWPTPEPYKDIGEAVKGGLNIRKWLFQCLENMTK